MCVPPEPAPKPEVSYSEQFRRLKGCKDPEVLKSAYPKPSKAAQAREPGAFHIPLSDVWSKSEQRPLLAAETRNMPPAAARIKNAVVTVMRMLVVGGFHVLAIGYAYQTFSWRMAGLAAFVYVFMGCIGINFAYHRLLTHKSFKTYKWLEYLVAWIGSNTGQGDPIEWVSHHRYHHLHCDTPLDPHSPFEGFWHAHILWLFCTETVFMDRFNTPDLNAQWFYRFMDVFFFPQVFILKPLLFYYLGGLQLVVWGIAVPTVLGWHGTFLVNSAAHTWGRRPYETGDLSTNCWWVAMVSFGEGWHNAHHAFPYSARHGLEWWEFDPTYYLIWTLEKLGLVWDVQIPSEKVRAARRTKAVAPKSA